MLEQCISYALAMHLLCKCIALSVRSLSYRHCSQSMSPLWFRAYCCPKFVEQIYILSGAFCQNSFFAAVDGKTAVSMSIDTISMIGADSIRYSRAPFIVSILYISV